MTKPNYKLLFKVVNHLNLRPRIDGKIEYRAPKFLKGRAQIITVDVDIRNFFFNINSARRHAAEVIAHEIGHYLVVAPYRRKMKDYGIPLRYKMNQQEIKKYKIEEIKAQLIEIDILNRINIFNYKKFDLINFYARNIKTEDVNNINNWWKSKGKQMINDLFNAVEKN